MKKKIVSASIYPAVLIGVGLLVTLFLLGYVVPRFSQIYDDTRRTLPWLSQLLLQWGRLLNSYGGLIALGGVVLLVLLVSASAAPRAGYLPLRGASRRSAGAC